MDQINKLQELFRQFPGIGPRQAKRFVYFLLHSNEAYRKLLAQEITNIVNHVHTCNLCYRFFDQKNSDHTVCSVCRDTHRNQNTLMIVAKDVDMDAIERSRVYDGLYFVLGDTLSLLTKEPEQKIRIKELRERIIATHETSTKTTTQLSTITPRSPITEIILALSLNTEGEHTREYIEETLAPLIQKHGIQVYALGRGLSTGTELEYSDTETIKNALLSKRKEIV